jgi:hypothetical protein
MLADWTLSLFEGRVKFYFCWKEIWKAAYTVKCDGSLPELGQKCLNSKGEIHDYKEDEDALNQGDPLTFP